MSDLNLQNSELIAPFLNQSALYRTEDVGNINSRFL